MELKQIAAIMLGVRNLDASVAFYSGKLGMTVSNRIPGLAFLDGGGGLMFVLSEELVRASEHTAGATEVVFRVDGVRAAYAALKERGVVFLNEPRVVSPPMWAANFRDPDGHLLSVFGLEG